MDTPDLRELLAKATQLAEVGDFTHAVEPLQQVLAHDETNVDALLQFGRCLAMLGRVDEAVKALEKLAKLQPEDVEVFNILGHVLLNARQPDLATVAFNRCLELNPNHVEAMRHLANWINFRGNPKNSCNSSKKPKHLRPTTVIFFSNSPGQYSTRQETLTEQLIYSSAHSPLKTLLPTVAVSPYSCSTTLLTKKTKR